MTEEQAIAETKYRLAESVFQTLHSKGAIDATTLQKLLAAAV